MEESPLCPRHQKHIREIETFPRYPISIRNSKACTHFWRWKPRKWFRIRMVYIAGARRILLLIYHKMQHKLCWGLSTETFHAHRNRRQFCLSLSFPSRDFNLIQTLAWKVFFRHEKWELRGPSTQCDSKAVRGDVMRPHAFIMAMTLQRLNKKGTRKLSSSILPDHGP